MRHEAIEALERKVQEAYRDLETFGKCLPKISTGEELEGLEGEIHCRTDKLARLILEHQQQQALDSEALNEVALVQYDFYNKRLIGLYYFALAGEMNRAYGGS